MGELRTDVDAVVVPVATGHVLVDVGVDARHLGQAGSQISDAMRMKGKGCWRWPRGWFRRGSLLTLATEVRIQRWDVPPGQAPHRRQLRTAIGCSAYRLAAFTLAEF
jgi:hypothetical protein